MKKISFLLGFLFVANTALAMPAQILLIRHGEKPIQGNELSSQGWERARALPTLFQNRPEFQQFGTPAALYAMAPAKPGGSVRAIQTLKFVSEKLSIIINSGFTRDQVIELVNDLKNNKNLDGKMIVICWEHSVLVDIANELGVKQALAWPGKQFDRIWDLTFSKDGKLVGFENLPQKLLPTDSQD